MGFLHRLKSIFKEVDFFHSTQMLRFRGESEYKTLTGGIISVAIIIVILIGFSQMIINTLNLSSINFTQNIQRKQDPSLLNIVSSPEKDFMFGI